MNNSVSLQTVTRQYKRYSLQPLPARMSLAELQDAMKCKISGKYFLDPVIICISNHPKLLVGESYDRESVKELLEKEPHEVVFQSNPSVQKFVTTLINRGVDRVFEQRPKKKLFLPQDLVDKVKTFLPPPRPPEASGDC